jgi:hypothetical protein
MKKALKNATDFFCKDCDFTCSKKYDWDRHIMTRKHHNRTNLEQNGVKSAQHHSYVCNKCNKKYSARNSLWYHEKKCAEEENLNVSNSSHEQIQIAHPPTNELVVSLLNQNMELQKQIIELCKEKNTVINNNTTNNTTNNNQFNLQVFLNEQCKDALNLGDFVEQIKLQLSDLDMIGRVGYVEGMSKIFMRNLHALDVFKRPIHCSDLKRETLYIKDKDSWEKENTENVKIKRAIKEVEHKNIKQIPKWREENPTSEDTETKKHLEYQNILLEAMGGSTLEDDDKKREKIIRNIAKEVVIDKNK